MLTTHGLKLDSQDLKTYMLKKYWHSFFLKIIMEGLEMSAMIPALQELAR